MNVAWCVMALALTGNTDEPTTSESAVCGRIRRIPNVKKFGQ